MLPVGYYGDRTSIAQPPIPGRALGPQFDGTRLAPAAGKQSTIFPLELLPLGDIDACSGKNHTEVEPPDGLDSIKPPANRVVNQLFGCFRRGGSGLLPTPSPYFFDLLAQGAYHSAQWPPPTNSRARPL